LNPQLVEAAKKRIPSVPLLINVLSKRVRQLNAGLRPMVKPLSREEEKVDIALREIADGKLTAEIEFTVKSPPEDAAIAPDDSEE
jgi:DNA-directed RNA polymerase subunit omega